MPELPEAETIARSLAPRIAGQQIVSARYPGKRVWRAAIPDVTGRRFIDAHRYGKQVLLEMDRGYLLVRLGMTGALLMDHAPGPFTRAEFGLANGGLLFDDIRQFGWLEVLDAPPGHCGPDPLEISAADFIQRLRSRRTEVKRLLLDQDFVRGVGNIYADEALFRAGLHPRASTARLKPARAQHLHAQLVQLLQEAIAHRGSSISDYVDASGDKGTFQLRHRVYGKEGKPCPNCAGLIRRIVVAQRGTHYCPTCQRK